MKACHLTLFYKAHRCELILAAPRTHVGSLSTTADPVHVCRHDDIILIHRVGQGNFRGARILTR